MSSYTITSWNQVIGANNQLHPLFTFVPDLEFMNYVENNPNPIRIELLGTQWYDGKHFASCYSSKDFPNYGPNFFSVTDNYVMVLNDIEFSFFPDVSKVGSFKIDMSVRSSSDWSCIDIDDNNNDPINGKVVQESFAIPAQVGDSVQDDCTWQKVIFILLIIIAILVLVYGIIKLFW